MSRKKSVPVARAVAPPAPSPEITVRPTDPSELPVPSGGGRWQEPPIKAGPPESEGRSLTPPVPCPDNVPLAPLEPCPATAAELVVWLRHQRDGIVWRAHKLSLTERGRLVIECGRPYRERLAGIVTEARTHFNRIADGRATLPGGLPAVAGPADAVEALNGVLNAALALDAGQRPGEPLNPAKLPSPLSAAALAAAAGLNPNRVESALRRYAETHPECRCEQENPRPNEPRYLYRTLLAWPVLQRMIDKDRPTGG